MPKSRGPFYFLPKLIKLIQSQHKQALERHLKPVHDARMQLLGKISPPFQQQMDHLTQSLVQQLQPRFSQKKVSPSTPTVKKSTLEKGTAKLAEGIVQLEVLRSQPTQQLSAEDWAHLEKLKAQGRHQEIDTFFRNHTQEQIKDWKSRLGIPRGRPRKLEKDKKGYQLAVKVQACLPRFEEGIEKKRELKKKNRGNPRRVERRLSSLGYENTEVSCLMDHSTSVSAACACVSKTSGHAFLTVQNYFGRYRKRFPELVPPPKQTKS